MKQFFIEFAFYVLINGLIFNLYLVKKLMQKISDFANINKLIRQKIEDLETILSNKKQP